MWSEANSTAAVLPIGLAGRGWNSCFPRAMGSSPNCQVQHNAIVFARRE